MIIGLFEYGAKQDAFIGEVCFLERKVQLLPTWDTDEDSPDYRVEVCSELGGIQVGLGWKRTRQGGEHYVSLTIDQPTFLAPIQAVLFFNEDKTTASLFWDRSGVAF